MTISKTTVGLATALGLAAGMVALSAPAFSADATLLPANSPWMVRLRGLVVMPDEKAHLSVVGGGVNVSNSVIPELDISYFFNENIAAELILGTSKHNVHGKGALAGADLGSVWLLPPTLTLQYHFNATDTIKPYIGAGVNYTVFYGVNSGGFASVKYKDSFGWALQAGVDMAIDDHWGLNLDVKKLFLDTKVNVNFGAVTGKVDLNPWIFGAGVSYRF